MAILGIVLLFVSLFPLVHVIAQHVLDVSHMIVDSSMIQSPNNGSFTVRFLCLVVEWYSSASQLVMKGWVSNTGFIPAVIHWSEPVRVCTIPLTGDHLSLKSSGLLDA